MDAEGAPYNAVVGLDFSELGDNALLTAAELSSWRRGSRLYAVHVAAAYGPLLRIDLADDVRTLSSEEAAAFLRGHVAVQLSRAGMTEAADIVHTEVRVGTPADEIVALAREVDADVIVVGTHGRRGMRRLLLGSVAEAVLRHARCPVLVVRPKSQEKPND